MENVIENMEIVRGTLYSWISIDECMVLDSMQLLFAYEYKDMWIAQMNHDMYFDFDNMLYVFNEEDTWVCDQQRERGQLAMLHGLSHGRWSTITQDYIYD